MTDEITRVTDFFDPLDPPAANVGTSDLFIRKFDEGTTVIRMVGELPRPGHTESSLYVGVGYHWDDPHKRSYPCVRHPQTDNVCVGCTSDDANTRRRKNVVVFPALVLEKNKPSRLTMMQANTNTKKNGAWDVLMATAQDVVDSMGAEEARAFDVRDNLVRVTREDSEGPGRFTNVNYRMLFLPAPKQVLEDELPEVTREEVMEAVYNEYARAVSSVMPDLFAMDESAGIYDQVIPDDEASDPWGDDPSENVQIAEPEVKKATRRRRAAKPKVDLS